ncbi:MAG: hypothetical protein V7L22_04540 [Nostoc sp.]|nr:hypothetical protein [Nostoc sp. C052]
MSALDCSPVNQLLDIALFVSFSVGDWKLNLTVIAIARNNIV